MKSIEFNEAFMGAGEPLKGSEFPGFGHGNRTPETSRVHKRAARSQRPVKPVQKGLARSAVSVVKADRLGRKFEVRVKGTRELVGIVESVLSGKGKVYAYRLKNDMKQHKGFASQKAAVERMLSKA